MLCVLVALSPALAQQPSSRDPSELPAGNEEVARVMREFKGRGEVGDDSLPATPMETLRRLSVPDDLQVELVASEPEIAQPLHVSFDFKGRMWVVQYLQYPFPAGLKIVRYDQHLRAVFDRVPEAPPNHVPGEDRVTVFEDTNGDGDYDSHRDVITGLNIATSVAVTPEGIWVMNPPYLLFYPDADQDAVIDGPPTVHLSGFGLEDTHSVANSIRMGPDGWLYGVNGSTTTAAVRAPLAEDPQAVTPFRGQCVWRYHPTGHRFEIFAEGGGNTFGLEITDTGLTFSGTNAGSTRGMFYPQGSYGQKSWGKHGPLTNPYAFGFFRHMRFEGDTRRFTQSFVVYQDDVLPPRYRDQIIAINPLQRCVVSSHLQEDTSTFRTEDFEQTIETDDRWFRPVNIAVGPDGGVYLADWYDTRLTHVDPRDNWHKSSGRIYRVRPADTEVDQQTQAADASGPSSAAQPIASRTRFDLTALDRADLLAVLSHPSRTIRFAGLDVLATRVDEGLDGELQRILDDASDPRRLEALWTLSRRGALRDGALLGLLSAEQSDADLRRWAIRLIGDRRSATGDQAAALVALAKHETDPRVRSQLASSAARLPSQTALPVIDAMLRRGEDLEDLHLPLLVWWALERHCASAPDAVVDLFEDPSLWSQPLVQEIVAGRLMRRFAAAGEAADFEACAALMRRAPDLASQERLMRGFEEAFVGRAVEALPEGLREQIAEYRAQRPESDLPLRLRQGEAEAVKLALRHIADTARLPGERIRLIETLGETRPPAAVGALRSRLTGDPSVAVRRAALQALSRYEDPGLGAAIASAYHHAMDDSSNLREIAIRVLASRPAWADALLNEIAAARIAAERVPPDVVMQMRTLEDPTLDERLEQHWGTLRATPEAKQRQIAQVQQWLAAGGSGRLDHGGKLYQQHCGKCHTLLGEGGKVGPDLTGYERTNLAFLAHAIVDPSAAIREEFTNYRILTVDGQVLTGLLEDQTPQTYVLRTAEGQAVTIARDDVEQLDASAVSLMPENLLSSLSPQDVRDLFAFLMRPAK
ncbi:DUF7133 domain-containing protein [Roseimaritima sediminicola]|uniref:DUF7133 domain-containing protein n=1 Tax=Roseimaritima sediminicola TaxID=2662066 RepID=UPI001F35CB4F|nr:HEAT repeat domain-containing protein [Roseimaritima sediminicola]